MNEHIEANQRHWNEVVAIHAASAFAMSPGLNLSPGGLCSLQSRASHRWSAKPGPPDVEAIAALRQRYDTQQVSALTAQG